MKALKNSHISYNILDQDKIEKQLTKEERQLHIKSACQDNFKCFSFIINDLYLNEGEFSYAKNYLLKYHGVYAVHLFYGQENYNYTLSDEDKKVVLVLALENSNIAIEMLMYEKDQNLRNLLIDTCLLSNDSIMYSLDKLNDEDMEYIYNKLKDSDQLYDIPFRYLPHNSILRKVNFIKKLENEGFVKNCIEGGNLDILSEQEKIVLHDLYAEEMFKYARRGIARLDSYLNRYGKYLFDFETEYLIKKELDGYSEHSLQKLLNKTHVSEQELDKIRAFELTKTMVEKIGSGE